MMMEGRTRLEISSECALHVRPCLRLAVAGGVRVLVVSLALYIQYRYVILYSTVPLQYAGNAYVSLIIIFYFRDGVEFQFSKMKRYSTYEYRTKKATYPGLRRGTGMNDGTYEYLIY